MQHNHDVPKEFLLRCHLRNATSDMLHRTLYRHSKCLHIVCRHCMKGASAARWLCKCGIAWIACPLCRPLGFACLSSRRKRGSANLASIGTTTIPPPPPKRRRLLPSPIGSADFRGRGKRRRRATMHLRTRKVSTTFSTSKLTSAGCNFLGPYEIPRPCEIPSASDGPPCGPRASKLAKQGPSYNQPCMHAASSGLPANSAGPNLKRALEATGGDGRTPKNPKDLRAQKDLRATAFTNASVSPPPSTTCVRGTGLCPMTSWTIDQYCPACHG